ncbi:MAG: HNH endonuclease [Paracoccus sp. (in: a-proteobacteria)]|nr:HNH endonuclease [Paracoccus sp. (in: a-proteobacteria)]
MKDYPRYSKRITRTRRWQTVRHAALERDGWACVDCGSRKRLEVDHVLPVRTHPELAFDLGNTATRCSSCHTRKTRIECGHPPPNPKRQQWQQSVSSLEATPNRATGVRIDA